MTRMLTIDDVADRLAVSGKQVRSLIQRGELPAMQVGDKRMYRVDEADLDAFVAQEKERVRARVAGGGAAAG